jgi:glucose-1-phosphatase
MSSKMPVGGRRIRPVAPLDWSPSLSESSEVRPEVVLFDLGGVLMDFGGLQRLADLSGETNGPDLQSRWASSKWLQAFERGHCGVEAFSAGVVSEWGLDLPPSEFVAEFRSWSAGPFEGSVELVRHLHGKIRMGCLSNTNPIHWRQHLDRWGLVPYFDWTFVSFELAMMKPDPEIYQHTIRTVGVPPERLLFLDDSEENVSAARDLGICSEHVSGINEVKHAISRHLPTLVTPAAGGDERFR